MEQKSELETWDKNLYVNLATKIWTRSLEQKSELKTWNENLYSKVGNKKFELKTWNKSLNSILKF